MKSVAMLAGASTMAPAFTVNTSARPFSNDKVTLKKGLGFGMIQEDLSLVDKFKLVKDLGFDGIELNTPTDLNKLEVLDAKEKSEIEIPSVVNKDHWKMPLSDPNPEIRKQCIESVAKSLYEVKEFGGDTVLVVPGVVNEKVTYEQAYNTALNSVRELIPHVEETGMQLAIENVWNNFLLSPVEAKRFVDEINHPLVGWYFDIGNILRYGWPEHWIKTLNSRVMKLHIKEFSVKKMFDEGLREGFNVNLLEGDNNWPTVMKAVSDVGHKGGWLTAEVRGGDRVRLKDISKRMDEIISYL